MDVNDESPTFVQSRYNITLPEDTAVSSQAVLTVSAVDKDSGQAGRVSYSIVSGDGTDKFNIDRDTGALSVISPLDYETKTSYRYGFSHYETKTSYRCGFSKGIRGYFYSSRATFLT